MMTMMMMMMMTMMTTTMMIMINAEGSIEVRARSGEAVDMRPDLTDEERRRVKDVRWTQVHLVISVKNNSTMCPHGRCQLVPDGSLRFSHVLPEDQGDYWMQAFDERGKRVKTTNFKLLVDAVSAASSSVLVPTLSSILPIIILIVIAVIVFRRHRSTSPGTLMESIYETMHGNRGNKDTEEDSERGLQAGAPNTHQEEDVYV